MDDLNKTKLIVELLRQTSTKEVVQEFLKSKNIPFSGTWEELLDKRIIPSVSENKISNLELLEYLRIAEEHGKQHIFLYECAEDKAIALIDRKRMMDALKAKGLEALVNEPKILDQPDAPTFTDARWEAATKDLAFILKQIETRESQSHVADHRSSDGKTLTKEYELVRTRAVNLVKLHRTGLLEIRISARSTGSTKYKADVDLFWMNLNGLLQDSDFRPIPLRFIKYRLMNEAKSLTGKIRVSNSVLRNEDGTTMIVASRGEEANLYDDTGASKGMKAFVDQDGYCEGSNFFFTKNANLSKDVHILLSGEINEFAITADCNREDYNYVLDEIRNLNKTIS